MSAADDSDPKHRRTLIASSWSGLGLRIQFRVQIYVTITTLTNILTGLKSQPEHRQCRHDHQHGYDRYVAMLASSP